MQVPRLAVMPHWRAAVDDVVETLQFAAHRSFGLRLTTLTRRRAVLHAIARRRQPMVVLCSDTGSFPLPPVVSRGVDRIAVFRLWWNGAQEVRDFAEEPPCGADPLDETHVCFFPESGRDLVALGLRHAYVPYAFSPPRTPTSGPRESSVCFTSEVDISDSCFGTFEDAAGLSGLAWQSAEDVVSGERDLVAVDQALREAMVDDQRYARTLWAVRNRVRFLLVQRLVAAFPHRVALRGADWQRLGFEAQPTSFERAALLRDYETHRVSLDLGSKSTHTLLYPRAADIMAVGGGLVQIDTGDNSRSYPLTWRTRQVKSATALIDLVDRMLTASPQTLLLENIAIHEDYCSVRLEAGTSLLSGMMTSD